MFDTSITLSELEDTVTHLQKALLSSTISSQDMCAVVSFRQLVDSTCDQIIARYERAGDWQEKGYLSAKSAVVHETGITRRSTDRSLVTGSLLAHYPVITNALGTHSITHDHLHFLLPLMNEKYCEFFDDDVDLLIETAKTVNAEQFSHVVRHWKNMVNALIDEPSDEYLAFQKRKLFLNELLDGTWLIHGELDCVTGRILEKALRDVSEKLWRTTSPENRGEYSAAQQRADAIGYLAQGYVTSENAAETAVGAQAETRTQFRYTPNATLNVDIIVDADDLNTDTTTRDFLKKCLDASSPLINTHSQSFVEQILCDSSLIVPVKNDNGTYDLGRSARTAPWKLKRQLLLSHSTCSVPGCTTPSRWCDAHHIDHWAHGGKTAMDNLALLCRRHHTMMHNDKTFAQRIEPILRVKPPPLASTG